MKTNDVVTVVTIAGEYIGKFDQFEENGTLSIKDPRVLINQDGQMGFAKGICMTGNLEPDTVAFKDYVYVTPTSEEFEQQYRSATSGILI